jgi:hypothetical protein
LEQEQADLEYALALSREEKKSRKELWGNICCTYKKYMKAKNLTHVGNYYSMYVLHLTLCYVFI